MDPFYINKYRDLMKYAAGTPPSERFETTHGFYMAVVQGFFRKHYYVRGTAVSFMAEEYPLMERYITPWKDILPEGILPCTAGNRRKLFCRRLSVRRTGERTSFRL